MKNPIANLVALLILFLSSLSSRAFEFNDTTLEALETTDTFLCLSRSKSLEPLIKNIGDINADGIDDLMISDTRRNYIPPFNPLIYIVFGSKSIPSSIDLDNLHANGQGFAITGDEYFRSYFLSSAGDINDDGINDFMFGFSNDAYVIFGRSEGFTDIHLNNFTQTQGFKIISNYTHELTDFLTVSKAGDFNNDGIDDIMVGHSIESSFSYPGAGNVYILFGHPGAFPDVNLTEFKSGTQGVKISGAQYNEFIGLSMSSVGDVNGDGIDDVVLPIGSRMDGTSLYKNKLYVIYGHEGEYQDLDLATLTKDQGFQITDREDDENGRVFNNWFAINAGDFDGDGLNDIAFRLDGSRRDPNDTILYVVFGVKGGYDNFDINDLQETQGLKILAKRNGDAYSLPISADINGDGMSDLLIGLWEGFQILFGRKERPSTINLDNLTSADGFRINVTINGPTSADCLDFNNDGALDIAIGRNNVSVFYGKPLNKNSKGAPETHVAAIVAGVVVPCVVLSVGIGIYIKRKRSLNTKANHENKKKMKPIPQVPGQDSPTALSWPTSPVASTRENEPVFFNTKETGEPHQRGLGVPERLIQLAPNEEGEEQQNEQGLALSSILEQAGQDEEASPGIFMKSN